MTWRSSCDDPYQNLANAIVVAAAYDYKKALRKDDKDEMKNIEKFFFSDWYSVLTNVSPDFLLDMIRRNCTT